VARKPLLLANAVSLAGRKRFMAMKIIFSPALPHIKTI
jgi:hypothetical protein